MILEGPPTTRDAFVVTGVVAGCALGLGVLLAAISTPKQIEVRVKALEAESTAIERLMKSTRSSVALESGTICATPPEDQVQAFREQLTTLANERNLGLTALDVGIDPLRDENAGVIPIRLRFEVSGAYGGAIELLRSLAAHRPAVFADTVDLSSQTSSVTLVFSGRVFCGG